MLALTLLVLSAAPDADKVQQLLLTQAKAWNAGDLKGFCSAYAADAVFVSPNGVTKGRDAVLSRYQKKYVDQKAMGTLSFEFVETRIKGDTASVVAKWILTFSDKPIASGHTLLVLHKTATSWEIVQDASM